MTDTPTTRPRFRLPRFSIRTMLMVNTMLVMAFTIVLLAMKVVPLQREVRQLRSEAGYLTIDDPTKLHAIQIETESPLVWKWKVWIPDDGRQYWFNGIAGEIPAEDETQKLTGGMSLTEIAGSEVIVTAKVYQDLHGKWQLSTGAGGGEVLHPLTEEEVAMLRNTRGASWQGIGNWTASFDSGESPVILTRRRFAPKDASYIDGGIVSSKGPGVLVWINAEEAP